MAADFLAQTGSHIANALEGGGGSSLHTFLDRFSGSGQKYVETIDPLGTFEVNFKFYPRLTPTGKKGFLERVGQALANSAMGAVNNALDNVSGGLWSNALNAMQNGKFSEVKKDFSGIGQYTFLEYVVQYNLIHTGQNYPVTWGKAEHMLDLDIGPYVQKITGLNIQMHGEDKAETPGFQDFPVNGYAIKPSGELQMDIVNTRAALHERVFYPWMRECVNPWWAYGTRPYTTATVTVDFTKHNDIKYVFTGVRPKQIKLLDATQQPDSGNITREVTFMYDFMFITSHMKTIDSVGSKLMGSVGALAGGAAKMLNIG